jgi:4-amino-4-deoxy-L-arabinose transferase-like glycosyltransferase
VVELLHHVGLVLAVLALGDAALRIASTLAPSGLERVIAVVVLGVAAAVIEVLALGLVGLGGSSVALIAAAALTCVIARVLLPRPELDPIHEAAAWWRRLDTPSRLAAAGLTGGAAAWLVWQLRFPSLGFDSTVYHYPEIAGWVENGRPGSVLDLSYEIPYGAYPLTDEVAQTWGAAIARSWVPVALWNPLLLVLLAGATWETLRKVGLTAWIASLGTAVLVTMPMIVRQLNEPQTDLPAMTWLVCATALALGAGRRPALLAPALVAGGLALGTKTTIAPLLIAALATGAYLARGRLRPLSRSLAVGLAGAFLVGGVWYARNLVEHGSPLWPFVQGPWGDPRPRLFTMVETTFLERPVATLNGRVADYASVLGGGWIVLAGALLTFIVAAAATRIAPDRRRPAHAAATIALLAVVAWSLAWGTGLPRANLPGAAGWPISTIRYLLPAIGAAILAVGLATRLPGIAAWVARAVLVVALGWNLVADARLGAPFTPPVGTLVIGVAVGVLTLGLALGATRRPVGSLRRLPLGAVWIVVAIAAGALMTPAANGFIERHVRVSQSTAPGSEVAQWFQAQPRFNDRHGTIAFAGRAAFAPLVGDHFTHRLTLIPRHEPCSKVVRRARRGPVLIVAPSWFGGILGVESYDTGRCLADRRPAYRHGSYSVYVSR